MPAPRRGHPSTAIRPALVALLVAGAAASTASVAACAGESDATDRARTAPAGRLASAADLESMLRYIERGWTTLRRTHAELPAAAVDPKLPPRSSHPVYVPATEDLAALRRRLTAEVGAAGMATIDLRVLPRAPERISEHGLLYLPEPYVVPGGMFNEMYGWDSFFIVLGLLDDGEVDLARSMVNNFVYQVEHYGTILNANRTYYLTRSQPPFLTRMVLAVYRRTRDRAWLAGTLPAIEKYHAYWTREPHLVPATGLSRYHDLGSGPAPEVLASRWKKGTTYYDTVAAYYREHEVGDYDERRFYDPDRGKLTDLFYAADRSMRESGFDPSRRFGVFNAAVLSVNPVCLNSLLYAMERDTADILTELGRGDPAGWRRRAETRRRAIDRYLWDDERGLYLDYDFESGARRDYPYATMFFPLWAGIASEGQAARVAANLRLLEAPGGLAASAEESGAQWDLPWGWAPLVWIAVQGLRHYGYGDDADRLSINFVSLVLKEYLERGAIFEKYDVAARESAASGIKFGYRSNEVGFGWTNGVALELLAGLPPARRALCRRLDGVGVGAARAGGPAMTTAGKNTRRQSQ
jgi:alpha,alpha-trehalase